MGLKSAAVFLALVGAALRAQAPPAGQSPCSNTPTYSPCELVFELGGQDAAAHPNPYVSVDLRIEFRSPRHRTFAIPAYWDGGRRMVVRFAPVEAGDWDYHVTSNIAEWNDRTGTFTTVASQSPGFIRAANVHHWAYSEKNNGLDVAHLWMGASDPRFGFEDDSSFRATVDARAAQKFNHLRGFVMGTGSDAAFRSPDAPDLAVFQRLDSRIRYLNQKGIIADLILAAGPGTLTAACPSAEQRRRFVRYLVARYAAMNVTWQGVDRFEDYPDGRALLREVGGLLKQMDPYQHPRTTGGRATSAPLGDDGWQDFVSDSTADDSLGAIEHQLYAFPFVNTDFGREDSGAGKSGPGDVDAAAFRHRLWNATMDGQYPTYANTGAGDAYLNSPGTKAMTAWFQFMSDTRHWELEPYFDVDGGRALALEDVEYVVYMEKPGPLELTVEKHGYDVYWVNPADGETVKGKKFSGDHFTGQPPDSSHDWVLHVLREGRVESMNRSYKFESREIVLQEVESSPEKVPFEIVEPSADLSVTRPSVYSVKVRRATRATRTMTYLWTGEVAAGHQGFRVLATGAGGTLHTPASLSPDYPGTILIRVFGMNANGKVYLATRACNLNQ